MMATYDRIANLAQRRWLVVTLVFVVTLVAYVRTVLPGVNGGDVGELQYAGNLLALTHPTGYPIYVLMGFVWTRIVPLGSVAYRMNLLSAVSGAAGCAVLAWMVLRIYKNGFIALASGITLGMGETFWGQAVIGDKYAFNTVFVALVVGLALWWAEEREEPHGDKLLYALSLAYGASFLHHRTMILFAPVLAFLVLYHERQEVWRNWRRTLIAMALVILPALIVYPIFLPLIRARNFSPSDWQPQGLGQWVAWMTDRPGLTGTFVAEGFFEQLVDYRLRLVNSYPLVVLIIALFGVAVMAVRQPANVILLLLSYVVQAALAANYRSNYRPFVYFLPSYVLLIYAYAFGLNTLWDALKTRLKEWPRWEQWKPATGVVLVAGLMAVPVVQFTKTYPLRRSEAVYGDPLDIWRNTLYTGDMGARLASGMRDLPENAVVIGEWEQATVLWYYQQVEKVRPDVAIVYPTDKLALYEDTDRNVCLTRNLPIADFWHPTNVDALVCLQRQPSYALPERATALGIALYDGEGQPQIELAGYWVDATVYEAGRFAPLVISWRALDDIQQDYSVSLQILDEEWNLVWSQDIAAPVMGLYPTSRWTSDEVVQDYHEFDIPREMPPGRYLWVVELYRQLDDGAFVQLRDADGNVKILGGTFEVVPD